MAQGRLGRLQEHSAKKERAEWDDAEWCDEEYKAGRWECGCKWRPGHGRERI